MKVANIWFDDPENLTDPSRIFITVMHNLELLDYARRYFERKGDNSSIQRGEEMKDLQANNTSLCLHSYIDYIQRDERGSYKTVLRQIRTNLKTCAFQGLPI